MLFSVEYDTGSTIKAYVIPDAAGTSPSVRVRGGGRDLATIEATEVIPAIVAAGRHATGRCGFLIDGSVIADLAAIDDLELIEIASELRVYRRRMPTNLATKVFRLETHLMRLQKLDGRLSELFQYWYPSVDRYGGETTAQVFQIYGMDSAFISGRVFFSAIELELSRGYRAMTLFRDPYDELAERLIVLQNIGQNATALLGARDALVFEPVIEALAEIEILDRAGCKRFLKRADRQVLQPLSNPLVRQLTAKGADETPRTSSMSAALQALSGFELLGLRSDGAGYAHAVGEMFSIDPATVPTFEESPRVLELGSILRESKDAERLLEYDLELFEHASRALAAV